ncbi:NADH-ubiquinone oxidoreductase chain 4-like [Nicotiana tabacum]|uniref:NADH-ubiquinone oxidoreductase chain 4-like n=1 Tax=Nicotiana tabacum TaxID=4097 RepID=A0AC58SJN8_TOBAC
MVFSMSPDRAPLVRLASERFFWAGSRPGPTGGHLPQRKHHCSTPPEKQKIRQSSGYLLELRPSTTGQFRFGATPDSTIIIGVWGSRQRKIKAAYQLFLYTLLGSVFMLLAILLILLQTGTTDLQISLTTEFSERRQIFLWIASFASFAVKVPMVPVHIWLPEAHVEAPMAGSVILAGIALKLGTYGFLRFSIPMFPEAILCSTPFIYTLIAIAIIYTSSTTLRQIDLKKIIACSSVAHMNLVTIGMFSQNMCAGRVTHQPTSNGGESIACRNKSLIRGVSKTLPSVPKTKAP